jgi:hypothetical protein
MSDSTMLLSHVLDTITDRKHSLRESRTGRDLVGDSRALILLGRGSLLIQLGFTLIFAFFFGD